MCVLTLAVLGAILAFAVFDNGGTAVPEWHYCVAAIGLFGSGYFAFHALRRSWLASLNRTALILLGITAGVCVLQLIPLPPAVLRILSPSSLAIHAAASSVAGNRGLFPISVVPWATLDATLTFAVCVVVFALVSDLAARRRGAHLSIPLVAIAALEAVLGILQTATGSKPGGASGTYQNHNHFAGLLEMCLPFAAMFGFAAWRRVAGHEGPAWTGVLESCAWPAAAAAMLVAAAASLSRMGFVASLAALVVSGAAVLASERRVHGRRFWLAAAGLAAVALLTAVLLPSAAFIERFDAGGSSGDIGSDARFGIWRDTLPLIAAFPLFGCGFGAFQSAFMHYQHVVPLQTVNFAHNDYLQLAAELGMVGFLPLAGFAWIVCRTLFRHLREYRADSAIYLYAACLGSLVAIALHSLVDFNLYKPANAMVVAWVAGIAIGERRRA